MENKNVSSILKPLFEGSGNHVTTSSIFGTYNTNLTTNIDGFVYTTAAMKRATLGFGIGQDNSSTLQQTNILLLAVLVVCFITLASVVAMCVCFLRRYCVNRQISQSAQEQYQTTLVSKTTSVTGLHQAHEYFSTKIEKSDQEQDKKKSELGVGRDVESTPNIISPQFDPISPVCYVPSEDAAPIYFRIKNAVTSTPASTQQMNHMNVVVDGNGQSPIEKQHIIFSVASPTSVYTSALSDHQYTPSSINAGTLNSLTKGPLTQSISWFVPLNGGIQREPLRHSVVDLFDDENSVDLQTSENAPQSSKKYKKSKKPTNDPLNEESESSKNSDNMVLYDIEGHSEVSTVMAESVPLMKSTEQIQIPISLHTEAIKCSKGPRLMSENSPSNIGGILCDGMNRVRSLSSPDEKTMWKQREERPVIFLEPESGNVGNETNSTVCVVCEHFFIDTPAYLIQKLK